MELEELFANRALLKKMSTQDHIQMHVLCKSPRLSHRKNVLTETQSTTPCRTPSRNLNQPKPPLSVTHLVKPPVSMSSIYTPPTSSYSSLNKPPSSSSSLNKPPPSLTSLNNSIRSMIKPEEQVAPPVVFVPEGYGCKVPKSFRRCTDLVKIAFLLLYIFGLPVVLYQLHTNLQNTKRRILHLNSNEFRYFINKLTHMRKLKSDVDYVEKSYAVKGRVREYKETSSQEESMMTAINKIREEINKGTKRSYVVASVKKWLKENPEFPSEKCHCDAVRDCADNGSPVESQHTTTSIVQAKKVPSVDKQSHISRNTFVKVYTRWGRNSCNTGENTTMLYHGFMATTGIRRGKNGANYLCLPDVTRYNRHVPTTRQSSFIYGGLLDIRYGDTKLLDVSKRGFYRAQCSVCQVMYRKNIVMFPGTVFCPRGWTVEYHGYIMSQRFGKKRTEFMCIDKRPDIKGKVTRSTHKVASLNFVETECPGLLCRTRRYVEKAEVACVTCSQ